MSVNNKNILITGISGFVGSYIAKTLIDQGAKVYEILRRRADGAVPNNLRRLGIARGSSGGDLENISRLGSALSVNRAGHQRDFRHKLRED
ncbi:GDP-mannose 4,6-dehydratase [Methanothrix sp.]|uniref:GDP-mannose 4,6-dehydratase n=1 Tax=Methanothrix sp. TaxID=90426 RepID=UPI00345E9C76